MQIESLSSKGIFEGGYPRGRAAHATEAPSGAPALAEADARAATGAVIPMELIESSSLRDPTLLVGLVMQLLDAVSEPTFVLDAKGRLVRMNGVARRWLTSPEALEALGTLHTAVARGARSSDFAMVRLEGQGCLWLARWTGVCSPASALARARSRWGLSERSTSVLAQLASGRSNKEIAAVLARSEVTVERHLTDLFRRAGCSSRTELLAKLYTL